MFTDVRHFQPGYVHWLEEWERDHGIPVRVLNGGWRGAPVANNNWTDRQVRGSGFTRQQASAQGLTIVLMGSSIPNAYINYGGTLPSPPAVIENSLSFSDVFYLGYADGYVNPDYPRVEPDLSEIEPISWMDTSGHPRIYGEITDRVVYFHWNLATMDPGNIDLDVLFAQLEDAIDSEATERRLQEMLARSFDNFMEFMNEGRINAQVEQLRTNITVWERDIVTYQEHLAQTIANAQGASSQMAALLAMREQSEDDWRAQYQMIADNPAVERILFRGTGLQIVTHPITLRGRDQYVGQTRWLGRFQIDVNLRNFSVRMRNLDNPQGGRDHPHVPNGGPCFGGNASEFTNLIGNGQFGIFTELIIQWLENYNPRDDWGQYARLWFEQPDADPRLQEQDQEAAEPTTGDAEQTTEPVAAGVTAVLDDNDIFADDEVYEDEE